MKRSTVLVLVGIALLLMSVAVPLVGLAAAEWDTDYVYTIQTDNSFCSDVVHETPDAERSDDFRIDYANLSTTGRQQFKQALADGQYVVEEKGDRAPDFQFTNDHVARGVGCYAVTYEGETYALRTIQKSQRVGPGSGRLPFIIGGGLLVLGGGSLLAGVGVAVKGRLE